MDTTREHPNAAMVRRLFQAFGDGDLATISASVTDDVTWHFPGRHGRLAGDHRGRDDVFRFLGSVVALTGGTFHLELRDVVANDRLAVAVFRGSGARNGKTLDNPTSLQMRIENGRIAELWEFVWDLYHVDEFWT
jgi:ketosteroid isomerase-like protein